MSTPKRIQRQRTKGWRMPEGAVYVGRPGPWGNPFVVTKRDDGHWDVVDENGVDYLGKGTHAEAVAMAVEVYVEIFVHCECPTWEPEEMRAALRGRDLACWCALSSPCHADVLLELANA